MPLTFATGNKGKFAEARAVLEPLGYELEQYSEGYPELQADTLKEVARWGAEWLDGRIEPPFFVEDAGLFIDELDGFPGVYSSYVYQTLGWAGILRLLEGGEAHAARFEAVIGYHDGGEVRTFRGVVEGAIASRARGNRGFGFDPIFIPKGANRTFAQMEPEEKSALSHRARALERFQAHLNDA